MTFADDDTAAVANLEKRPQIEAEMYFRDCQIARAIFGNPTRSIERYARLIVVSF